MKSTKPQPSLSDSMQFVKGVGPRKAELLSRLGLKTLEDGLGFFPHRYEDRTRIKTISEIVPGEFATFTGTVIDAGTFRMGRRKKVFEVLVQDPTGTIRVKWFRFREKYMVERYAVGQTLVVSGKTAPNRYIGHGLELVHPDIEVVEEGKPGTLETGHVVPVYSVTEGLHQKSMRQMMKNLLDRALPLVDEYLPPSILEKMDFPERKDAIANTHFPTPETDLDRLHDFRTPGQIRLIFEELLLLQLGLTHLRLKTHDTRLGNALKTRGELIKRFVKTLPFDMTGAQKKVLAEIMVDLEQEKPMNRMLHGDVGSGKTLVALTCLLTAVDNGFQSALMAPTELLAEQHYLNITPYCETLGIRVHLATSALTLPERRRGQEKIEAGEIDLVVGTHALIQKDVNFKNLALVVIDEQHRFGVLQREALSKKGKAPHMLVMTATPIPRSLALTLYGDLDISQLDEMPPGRQPIKTRKFYENRRDEAYEILNKEIGSGRQAYVVCPLIEESDTLDLKNAQDVFEEIKLRFPKRKTGLIHGRLKQEERQKLMLSFKNKELDILVATTVIEVGIDVPNATVILIEHAERFGLAQLHQLRGRVGRGTHPSLCLLVAYPPLSDDGKARLDAMVRTQDGFLIAEEDLKIRGPGDIMGTRQSGLPMLRIANLVRDLSLIQSAREEASRIIGMDPALELPEHQKLKYLFESQWGERIQLASIL